MLSILGFVTIYPFLWMVASAFKPQKEILAFDQTFFPKEPTFANFISANNNFDFMRLFFNSILIAVVVTLCVAYTSTIAGYVLSKYKFKGRGILFAFIMATLMVPWSVTIIPKYSIIEFFGWMNSYKALIIPALFNGMGVFLLRQQIQAIPDEIIEAARIDGANEFYIFHRIIFPMARNGVASIVILQFLWTWEDFLWPYLVIDDRSKQMLSVGLRLFNGQFGTNFGALFAATTLSVIPVLVVYLVFQKQFIAGVASSAVKG